jgi:hypothetical protein
MAKQHWEAIRDARSDLTDYVVHLTRSKGNQTALEKLLQILRSGVIKPTFGPKPISGQNTTSITVKGPAPAVCLTEQTIAAIVKTLHMPGVRNRYRGYGIAYHKVDLYYCGGRPVLYGTSEILGHQVRQGERGWKEGKEIYTGGLPADHQYLFVRYEPKMGGSGDYPCDWTWEREWRLRANRANRWLFSNGGLPVLLSCDDKTPPRGAIIVERDEDIPKVNACLDALTQEGVEWASRLRWVVSLETAERKLTPPGKDARYARLETWPAKPQ